MTRGTLRDNEADGAALGRVLSLVRRLRGDGGCPWDQAQTHASLRRYVLEEAYEVADAIDSEEAHRLRDELGDLLLQVALHSVIAEEEGGFRFADVADALAAKIVRRHPHVFGDARVDTAQDVVTIWREAKAREREAQGGDSSVLGTVVSGQPSLSEADRLSRRAAVFGFDWTAAPGAFDKVAEELAELRGALGTESPQRVEEEYGDLLFTVATLGRWLGADPEVALHRANRKFRRRFEAMEARARAAGQRLDTLGPAEWDDLWESAKADSRDRGHT